MNNIPIEEEPISNASVAVRDDQDIIDIIDAFKIVNLSYGKYFGNTTQRAAAARLVKIHGKDRVLQVISILEQTNKMQFFPVITTPVKLENEWANLAARCQRLKAEKEQKNKSAVYGE